MKPAKPITVLLADDHALVRHGLRALLNADGHFAIVGEARNGRAAVALARTLRPDVILMDIAMPVLNGLEATGQILAANPLARVIILSAHSDDAYVERTRGLGVVGFVEKQTSAAVLIKAVHAVARGGTFFSPTIARRLNRTPTRLRHGKVPRPTQAAGLAIRKTGGRQPATNGSARQPVPAKPGRSSTPASQRR